MKKVEKLKELQGHQRTMRAHAAQIQKVQEDHKLRLSEASAAEDQLAELKRHREDLEAEAALGQDVSKRLATVVKEIEVASKRVADFDQLKATLAGLDRKLLETNQDLVGIESQVTSAKVDFLMEEAEALGSEYLAAAEKVMALLRRLVALNSFLAPMGYPIAYGNWRETAGLPAFHLQCHEGAKRSTADESLLDITVEVKHYHQSGGYYQADIDTEVARLKAAGIEL